ncbi:MAG: MFS transporter [Dehalococcoidia bacterium]
MGPSGGRLLRLKARVRRERVRHARRDVRGGEAALSGDESESLATSELQRGSLDGGRVALGLSANWRQFALLVAVNAFVGGMIGLERTIVPLLAREEFGIASKTAAVSFIATFGLAKAIANLFAGRLSERYRRKSVLVAGWLFALPVPFLLIWAPSWGWVIGANVLLGLNQGLAWSMTVNMKVDLVGPKRRGLALGLNEAAGYLAVAVAAFLTGVMAERWGLRPEPFYLGIGFAACGLALSLLLVRDTASFVELETAQHPDLAPRMSLRRSFAETTWRRPALFGVSQAGFVNNLNDALAWGIFPIFFVSRGLGLRQVAILAAAYPLVWGALQVPAGWSSDFLGRRVLVVSGMLVQGAAILLVARGDVFATWLMAVMLLGVGTALVYPTLMAAIADAVHPAARATSLGVYRFWRDAGAIAGALVAGAIADVFGLVPAIDTVAALTIASGLVAAGTMASKPRKRRLPT